MPSHPDRVRRHYLKDLDRAHAEWSARVIVKHLPYDITDDRRVQTALDADRLAWGVTANVIEGEHH